jgi:hypothetical protein
LMNPTKFNFIASNLSFFHSKITMGFQPPVLVEISAPSCSPISGLRLKRPFFSPKDSIKRSLQQSITLPQR